MRRMGTADALPVRFGQRTVTGTHIFPIPDFYTMCNLITAKGLRPGEMVTHRFLLDQVAAAFELLDKQSAGKIVCHPRKR